MRTAHWYDCTSREASAEANQPLMRAAMTAQFAAQPFEARIDGVISQLEEAVEQIRRIQQDAIDDGDEQRSNAVHVAERIIHTVTWGVANAQLAYLVTCAATLDRTARAVAELTTTQEA